jgi:Co/Zn/Cd efflux system component
VSDACCGRGVEIRALQARQKRVLTAVLLINAATFAMMLVAALVSRSSSLLSGSLDNLGDALTYALSLAVVSASAQAKAKVAMVKACLIAGAGLVVAAQIAWRLANPAVPIFETMGVAALFNLGANLLCLWLLTPYRHADVNMASVWECSRNDVLEGCAVIAAAVGVWIFKAGWPDLAIAVVLLLLFARSAARVMRSAAGDLRASTTSSPQNA